MDFTRRQFLKLSGATAVTLAVVELGFDDKKAKASSKEFKIAALKPTPTICPFCGVGCGILVYANEYFSLILFRSTSACPIEFRDGALAIGEYKEHFAFQHVRGWIKGIRSKHLLLNGVAQVGNGKMSTGHLTPVRVTTLASRTLTAH